MTKYFIKLNEEQKGPFTIDELKDMNLTDLYLYWTEGYTSWRKIAELKDLESFILKLPPSEDKNLVKINAITKQKTNRALLFVLLGGLIIFFFFGGFADKYDLLDQHGGLAASSYGDEAAMKVRAILIVVSLIISGIIGLLIYYQQMMSLYKKIYEKKEL